MHNRANTETPSIVESVPVVYWSWHPCVVFLEYRIQIPFVKLYLYPTVLTFPGSGNVMLLSSGTFNVPLLTISPCMLVHPSHFSPPSTQRYFADEYSKTSMYWSSLCDLMTDNDGSTQQVMLLFFLCFVPWRRRGLWLVLMHALVLVLVLLGLRLEAGLWLVLGLLFVLDIVLVLVRCSCFALVPCSCS